MNNKEEYKTINISLEEEIKRRFNESERRMQEAQTQKRRYEELDEERRRIFGGDYEKELNYEGIEEKFLPNISMIDIQAILNNPALDNIRKRNKVNKHNIFLFNQKIELKLVSNKHLIKEVFY